MSLLLFDHVNIRTANLATMSAFYSEVLGMPAGYRPPFGFGGAWHYCGEQPAVHLVEMDRPPRTEDPQLEHFAFQARDMAAFLKQLREKDIPYRIAVVPELEIHKVNIADPDGNHIHIDFTAEDAVAAGAAG
ncbi:MAG: glyoxalase [Inquilinus sp.]|nr:glyoxalase [Inquilinus sp.]